MGFGTVATEIIIFMAVIVIAGALAINMNSFSQQAGNSIDFQKENTLDKIATQININSIKYSNLTSPPTVTIYARNIGEKGLSINQIQIFVDGKIISNSDKTLAIEPDTSKGDSSIWDAEEILLINISVNLTDGKHSFKITGGKNTGIEDSFVSIGGASAPTISCPPGYILVPKDNYFTFQDFCVMKYPAKNVSGFAASQASNTPWINVTLYTAASDCSALGTKYHLIRNTEWMTIARNIEAQSTNWANGVTGSTVASGGGLFRGNVGLSDSASCNPGAMLDQVTDGTNCLVGGIRNKRVLYLSNGEFLWDFSGNQWQVVDVLENATGVDGNSCNVSAWRSYYGDDGNAECAWQSPYSKSLGVNRLYEIGPSGNYNSNYGIGRIFGRILTDRSVRRGGYYTTGVSAGIYSSYIYVAANYVDSTVGFRCTYTP